MMDHKNIIINIPNLLFLFVFSFSLTTSSQIRFDHPIKVIEPAEFLATYSLKYHHDSLNPNFINQEDMLLLVGQHSSKFIGNDLFVFDTICRRISTAKEFQALLLDNENPLPMTGFNYRIFKNHPKGKLTFIEHTLDGTFKYEESLELFNWQLTGDTATIAGYKTQKATTEFGGRKWIAWFSPDLPFNDGPYKFNGLPGLIVKVQDTRNHYIFVLVSIEKPSHKLMIDYKKKNFIIATKQDLFRAKDAFRENIINRAKNAGLSLRSQQTATRNIATHNNPLELKRK